MGIDRLELAWAAGFFDGEGSTFIHRDASRPGYLRLEVSVPQKGVGSVPEVLVRFKEAMAGIGRFAGPNALSGYHWRTRGRSEALMTIALLWNDLGEVKREQANAAIRDLLDHYERGAFVSRNGRHSHAIDSIVAAPPDMSPAEGVERAWAAGFLDGEGCFGIARKATRAGGPDWMRIRVSASQHGRIGEPPEVLMRLRRILGGRIERHGEPDDFKWVAEGQSVAGVFESVRPFLGTVKAHQAEVALRAFTAQVRLRGDSDRCKRGHLYTYVTTRGGHVRKVCLPCARLVARRARARQGIAPRQFRNEARRYTE